MSDATGERPRPARRPVRTAVLATVVTTVLVLLCCTGGAGALLLTELGGGNDDQLTATSMECGDGGVVNVRGRMPRFDGYGEEQIRNAAVIIKVGAEMHIPPRGWVIAVATAMQESRLLNLPHLGARNDHDSIGLFQQRPSQGWGTPAQLRDPAYAARKFYEKLRTVDDWQELSLTRAAQRVQRSAFPDAYAKHEELASRIVDALSHGAARTVEIGRKSVCDAATDGRIAASGWTAPIPGVPGSGFRTADRPAHNGVDLPAPKHTLIRAAAAGRVLVARCDPDHQGRRSCDVDGWPGKGGCGWFVDILHANNYITRYCHMIEKPRVSPGETVRAGQVIGEVGSSGNSSGPHLHFEVHISADRSSQGAIDPVPFMRERGAPLRRTP